MPDPKFLNPNNRLAVARTGKITTEEIERLKNIDAEDFDFQMPHDLLDIIDNPRDDEIGHLVFSWLNADHRQRVGMGHWRWVTHDLSKLVRSKGIVKEAIGSQADTDMITNGDLILAFMPRVYYEKRKEYLRRQNQLAMRAVIDQEAAESEINHRYQELDPDVKVTETRGGHEVSEE